MKKELGFFIITDLGGSESESVIPVPQFLILVLSVPVSFGTIKTLPVPIRF